MPSPYGMGQSYIPQYQQQGQGGYSQSPAVNPFQTPSSPMAGPPPAQQMNMSSPRMMDATGVPNPQGAAYSTPFNSISGFQQAPLGYQQDPNSMSNVGPWYGGQNATSQLGVGYNNTNYLGANPISGPLAFDLYSSSPTYAQGLSDVFTQKLPGQGGSWEQYQNAMQTYMNNLNSWNQTYSNNAQNTSTALSALSGISGGTPNPFGSVAIPTYSNANPAGPGGDAAALNPVIAGLNYSGLYNGASNAYNNMYNTYLNQGQFGLTGTQAQNGLQNVGGR